MNSEWFEDLFIDEAKAALESHSSSGGSTPVIEALTITENGTYNVPEGVDGYNPVNVEVTSTGGGGSVSKKDVNFYDYDGTLLHSYTVAEAQALSELPALPEQPGLVCQGWNWTMEDIKAHNRAVDVGATYTTDDGTTRLYIHLEEGRMSPVLGICVNGTVTVDWGDGTTPNKLTGTSDVTVKWTTFNHNYAEPGDYVIRLTVDGTMGFNGEVSSDTGSCVLRYTSGSDKRNYGYQNSLKKVEIGNGVTSIRFHAFENCYSLESVVISNSVTSIGEYAFERCTALEHATIPNSVPSIPENLFTYCHSATSIVIGNGATSIGKYAFSSCYGVRYYDFTKHTAVPTLENTNAFNYIPADCEIRVPAALYDEWIAATNWTTYASQIVAV